MSGLDPFRLSTRVANSRPPAVHDGRAVIGGTPYRTRAGKPVGLDWDALRGNDSDAEEEP